MNANNGWLIRSVCVIVVAMLADAALAQPQDPRIKQVAADWKARLERSGIVKYQVKGTSIMTKEYLAEDEEQYGQKFDKDVKLTHSFTAILDFRGKRQRTEYDVESLLLPTSICRRVTTTTFDGKSYRGAGESYIDGKLKDRKPNSADVAELTENLRFGRIEDDLVPLLAGHGVALIPPRTALTIENMYQEAMFDDALYYFGEAALGDRACVVLRTHANKAGGVRYSELWIDAARESALVRRIDYEGKTPVWDLRIAYVETPKAWLVDSYTVTLRGYGREGRLETHRHDEFTVTERVLDYPAGASEFKIPILPGMLVERYRDETAGNEELYRIDRFGRYRRVTFEGTNEQRVWDNWDYATLIVVSPLALVGVWLGFRMVRRLKAKRVSTHGPDGSKVP